MNIKKIRETTCDKCHRIFYRKLIPPRKKGEQRRLTAINDVTYWTEGEKWNDYQILCRSCLNEWFEKYRVDFSSLVPEEKQKMFYQYRYIGTFDKSKEAYKKNI
ncbi:MAG: hypothetical protein MRERV_55c002 [Mycoplasmataceae bacterium RV_VA103A]|nr:MAG: hypothetical protein MRERV_55c002 [Mycoplasmataceae bacterium RV_VA103A]